MKFLKFFIIYADNYIVKPNGLTTSSPSLVADLNGRLFFIFVAVLHPTQPSQGGGNIRKI
jgi:hypothetical protein